MAKIDEIKELKKIYVDGGGVYSTVRDEQKKDDKFIDDTFDPEVKAPHKIYRSGIGNKMVNSPAEHIVTDNPQAFFEVYSGREKEAIATRLSTVVNRWIQIMKRQNPNPFKESVKNPIARGETYIQLCHNELWIGDSPSKKGLPVQFLIPEPMVTYSSREEDNNGIPAFTMLFYERQPNEVLDLYPEWTNPKDRKEKRGGRLSQWFGYWDADTRYFEADGEPVLSGGVQPNIYGLNPFIRKYSGFGRKSPDGDLAKLIVSDIKFSRDLIKEECNLRSDFASISHLTAHKALIFFHEGKIDKKALQESFSLGVADINEIELEKGANYKIEWGGIDKPPVEIMTRLSQVRSEIAERCPFILAGFPRGSSGRQDDLALISALRRYDTVVENTENAFATAFEKALEICRILKILPDGLHEGDLNSEFRCVVKLKARDLIEEDRMATLGSRLVAQKEIDPITNLTQFKGYTEEDAKKIMVRVMAWDVIMNSPDIKTLIGMRAAEKSGMLEDLQMLKQQGQPAGQGLVTPTSPSGQERIMGEVQTQMGREMSPEGMRGARIAPEAYTRG